MKLKIIRLLLKGFWKITRKKKAKSKNKKGYISIKVIGIGCGGCNIIDMLREKLDRSIPLIACDTDKCVIERSKADIKIKIGDSNWGCGNNSEKGIQEIESDIIKIKNEFKKRTDLVFCVTCLGGGFSNGATPIIIDELKRLGIEIISIIIFPFLFEGMKKFQKSLEVAKHIKDKSEFLFGFGNDNLIDANKHLSLLESLNQNNKLISEYISFLIEQAAKHNSIDLINTYFKLGINAVIPNLIIEDGDIIIN